MDDTISVEIRLFARLREQCGGRASVDAEIAAGASVQQCFEHLCGRFEAAKPFRRTLAVAVNDEYAAWERELRDGDVVAFIPPVSGGAASGRDNGGVTTASRSRRRGATPAAPRRPQTGGEVS